MSRDKAKKGAGLIEATLAMVILSILVIGGASFVINASMRMNVSRDKIAALAKAESCLEQMKAADYNTLKQNIPLDYIDHYIKENSSSWILDAPSDPYDNANPVPMVRYIDKEGDFDSYDYLQVTIEVRYRSSTGETVKLETYIGSYR